MSSVEELREMLARERPNVPCLIHDKKISVIKGLGDVVAKMTKAIGIKPCVRCKKRQQWLNEKFSIKQTTRKII